MTSTDLGRYTDVDKEEDVKVLHSMGYAQELERRMSRFSNFAISFSIICILSGGINSLAQATSGAGGARHRHRLAGRLPVSLRLRGSPSARSARPIRPPAAFITGARSSAIAAPAG